MTMLSGLYASAATARRRFYTRRNRQRRLAKPVISVGNLRVGGTGKTPTAAYLAALLLELGERPAILSRGYGRRVPEDGVVVVSDGRRICADLDRSGDEPLMLARAVERARVLVAADRYLAGRVAELHLEATVHVLDDGFQHLSLARGTDLLIVGPEDLDDSRTLPEGRLREPLAAAAAAHALLVPAVHDDERQAVAAKLGVSEAFRLERHAGEPRQLQPSGSSVWVSKELPVLAVAGIGRPDRFFDEARAEGWDVRGALPFADHHRYTASDVRRMMDAASAAGARAILTTEKDLVRLLPFAPLPLPLMWLPLTVRIEPAQDFRAWLAARLASERSRDAEVRA